MNQKSLSMILLSGMMLCFSGCAGSSTVSATLSTEQGKLSEEFPTQIQETLTDNMSVDASISFPVACARGTGKKAELNGELFWDDQDRIKNLLLQDAEIQDSITSDLGTSLENTYLLENETHLSITTNGYLGYGTKEATYIDSVLFSDALFDDYNGDVYQKQTNLGFMSQQEAWERVLAFLKELNVTCSADYTCYVMDYETMKAEEERINTEAVDSGFPVIQKEEPWTSKDDCYYFKTTAEWEGYPVLPALTGEGADAQNISIIINKDGLQSLYIAGYCPLGEGQEFKIESPALVVSRLQEQLGNIISEDRYLIQDIALCQKVQEVDAEEHTAVVLPVWKCTVLVKNAESEDNDYTQTILLDAETLNLI